MTVGVVITAAPGRTENLTAVLDCLAVQTTPAAAVVLIEDGGQVISEVPAGIADRFTSWVTAKHEPGREQPRNLGVRALREGWPDVTHVWFLDSDIIVESNCLEELLEALDRGPEDRIVIAPYDWCPPGMRPAGDNPAEVGPGFKGVHNDPRWEMFHAHDADHVFRDDLSAGLACFSGNLVWNVAEFQRVGGFWNELHHGRCEDGELGLRAVAMGVPIGLTEFARGWHLWHPIDRDRVVRANERDVPMLNERHPWVQGSDVFMVDRDGKAFDTRCGNCGAEIPTGEWWQHAADCGADMRIEKRGDPT